MAKSELPTEVRARYEAWWNATHEAAASEIAAGERNLARLIHRVFSATVGKRPVNETTSIVFGAELSLPFLAAHRIARDWIADTVIAHAGDCDAIIELGSGWGYNLFNIWLRGGPDIPYWAFEFTEAGRTCCAAIAGAADSGPRLNVVPFDYRAVDFSPVRQRYKRPLVYTSHSIEQIQELPQDTIDQVVDLAPSVTVIHIEPVGWQFDASAESDRVKAYCLRQNYNRNLWTMLKSYEARGLIAIDETRANVMAPKLINSSSLVRWRKL